MSGAPATLATTVLSLLKRLWGIFAPRRSMRLSGEISRAHFWNWLASLFVVGPRWPPSTCFPVPLLSKNLRPYLPLPLVLLYFPLLPRSLPMVTCVPSFSLLSALFLFPSCLSDSFSSSLRSFPLFSSPVLSYFVSSSHVFSPLLFPFRFLSTYHTISSPHLSPPSSPLPLSSSLSSPNLSLYCVPHLLPLNT